MKKKILTTMLALAMVTMTLSGCGNKETVVDNPSTESVVTDEVTVVNDIVFSNDYVDVYKYRGLTAESFNNVISEDEVDVYIEYVMNYMYQPMTEIVTDGDITDGNTEESIETPVEQTSYTIADLTDEMVAEITNNEYNNVTDYRAYIKNVILEENKSYYDETLRNKLFQRVVDNSTLKDYEEEALQGYIDYANEYYQEYAEYLGMDFTTFYTETMGFENEDAYNDHVKEESLNNLKTEYIILAIAENENIVIEEKDIDAQVQTYIAEGYFVDETAVMEYISREEIAVNLKYEQILEIMVATAIYEDNNTTSDVENSVSTESVESNDVVTSNTLSEEMSSLKDAIVSELAGNYYPDTTIDAAMLESMYGVTSDMYSDYLGEIPMINTNVDTLLVIKANDDKIDAVKEALTLYRDSLVADTMQYPQNLGKIQASTVEVIGNYVCFIQLGGEFVADESMTEADSIKKCQEENAKVIEVIKSFNN